MAYKISGSKYTPVKKLRLLGSCSPPEVKKGKEKNITHKITCNMASDFFQYLNVWSIWQ
ncbi:MAG: hypothetical protein K0R51_3374 [Cytophagaceae bacterium]|nr:hypothetical protein [Cytophagaceae bacterium]